jgi:hypothetical protein
MLGRKVNRAPLGRDEEELLAIMIEAARAVAREQRHPFIFVEYFGGTSLVHNGLAAIGREGYRPLLSDLQTLFERGLIRLMRTGSSDYSADVRPEGVQYYEQMQVRRGPADHEDRDCGPGLPGDRELPSPPRGVSREMGRGRPTGVVGGLAERGDDHRPLMPGGDAAVRR